MHIATYIYACSFCNIGDKSYIIICLHFMSGSEPKHQTVGKSVTLNIVEYKQNLNYSSCVLLGWAWPMLCYNKWLWPVSTGVDLHDHGGGEGADQEGDQDHPHHHRHPRLPARARLSCTAVNEPSRSFTVPGEGIWWGLLLVESAFTVFHKDHNCRAAMIFKATHQLWSLWTCVPISCLLTVFK